MTTQEKDRAEGEISYQCWICPKCHDDHAREASCKPEESTEVKLRMDAYYYSFEPTGVLEIDRILSAVATAGKDFHHTDQWNEKLSDGTTYIQMIQQAANEAAGIIHERSKKVETASVERERLKRFVEAYNSAFSYGKLSGGEMALSDDEIIDEFLKAEQERAKR